MSQLAANILVSAALYLSVGIGFALVYSTAHFFHIAHGIVMTIAAYVVFVLRMVVGLAWPWAVIGGVVAGIVIGVSLDRGVYRVLRLRGGSSGALLLASLGLYVALQALVVLAFGSGTRVYGSVISLLTWSFGDARLTVPQLAMIGLGAAGSVILARLLTGTNLGRLVRATASDASLARGMGVQTDSVISLVFVISSALAGCAGILMAADSGLTPSMGFAPLTYVMIAFIFGGGRGLLGLTIGSLALATLQHMSAWWLSSQWQDSICFGVLLLVLSLRLSRAAHA